MAGGRPSKMTPELMDHAREYLKDENYKWMGSVIPSAVGLAAWLKITTPTIYDWRDKYPEFSCILSDVEQAQHEILLGKSLEGGWNASIAKMILTKHGYSDKIQQELSGEVGGQHDIRITFVDPDESDDD